MALQNTLRFHDRFSPIKECKLKEITSFIGTGFRSQVKRRTLEVSTSCHSSSSRVLRIPLQDGCVRGTGVRASRSVQTRKFDNGKKRQAEDSSETDEDEDDFSASKGEQNDPYLMDPEERREWRKKIREVMHKYPDVDEEFDPEEKRTKMQKLLADYPLVVEEDDPDWPEDADGWGFNLGQFFNKITIKNAKKDDDENNDSENEIVWQDDDYIRPIKDITSTEWEETVFKDISPLIVLVHNRYKRPKENQRIRDELEKAVHIIWNCRLPHQDV